MKIVPKCSDVKETGAVMLSDHIGKAGTVFRYSTNVYISNGVEGAKILVVRLNDGGRTYFYNTELRPAAYQVLPNAYLVMGEEG